MTPILEGLRTSAWRLVLVEADYEAAGRAIYERQRGGLGKGGLSAERPWRAKDVPGRFWDGYVADAQTAMLSASPDATAALLAEIEGLRGAVAAVTDATSSYLPPDGISAPECISRVIAATDNPEINAIMIGDRNGTP